MSNELRTADRALQTLQAFSPKRQTLTVGGLAEILGVHKSTASRLVATLLRRGFLERLDSGDAFRLGPELGRLGLLVGGGGVDLVALAREPIQELANRTGETVNIAVLDSSDREPVIVAQADGPHIVGIGQWNGRRTPAHCTAIGKVLLACSDGVDGAVDAPLKAYTERTVTDPELLRAQLEQVRRDGYAIVLGEYEEGLHAVAAPIHDAEGCRAALSVSGPSYRLPPERLPELAALCRAAAAAVSAGLGGA